MKRKDKINTVPEKHGYYRIMIISRSIALFIGVFSLLNLLGGWIFHGFNANLLWIDLRSLSGGATAVIMLCASAVLITFSIKPKPEFWRMRISLFTVGVLLFVVLINLITYYKLLFSKTFYTSFPVPFSLIIAIGLIFILFSMHKSKFYLPKKKDPVLIGFFFAVILFLFPVFQMLFFGKTDYRRKADAAVVLGARVYSDGGLSNALEDRVNTGIALYKSGLVKKIIFSGGQGDGNIHETQAMKNHAVRSGVPAQDILLDAFGVNTDATVRNTVKMFNQYRFQKILVVSHFYHLPRIKMRYWKEGWEIYTVPAEEKYVLKALPIYMMREIAALWVYYIGKTNT